MLPATPAVRAHLLQLIRSELAGSFDHLLGLLGLASSEFEALYDSRGEVRTIRRDGAVAGYCWIERRGRELHLHAIFVLRDQRGRGIGSDALRSLESEFRGSVDLIELGVEQTNDRARSLYERHGFRVERSLPEHGFDIMRKRLAP